MTEQKSVTLHIPATTANLGPGFDCLALALDMWNEVTVHLGGQGYSIQIEGEGIDQLPHDGSNLILQAMARMYKEFGHSFPLDVALICRNAIPVRSGLGSSASAVIAGLLAAGQLLGKSLSTQDLLDLAVEFEGHADNVAACLLGGMVIVARHEESWIVEQVPVQPIKAVFVLPENRLSTREARAVLPEMINRPDAVDNISRAALLVHALRENRMDLLSVAMQDNLHQPQRLKLIPGAEEALRAAYNAGAYGAALSGAGPGLIAFGGDNLDAVGKAMQQAFMKVNVACRVFQTQSTGQGTH